MLHLFTQKRGVSCSPSINKCMEPSQLRGCICCWLPVAQWEMVQPCQWVSLLLWQHIPPRLFASHPASFELAMVAKNSYKNNMEDKEREMMLRHAHLQFDDMFVKQNMFMDCWVINNLLINVRKVIQRRYFFLLWTWQPTQGWNDTVWHIMSFNRQNKMSYIEQCPSPFLFLSLQQSGAAGEGEGRDAENEIRMKKEDCWKPRLTTEQWPVQNSTLPPHRTWNTNPNATSYVCSQAHTHLVYLPPYKERYNYYSMHVLACILFSFLANKHWAWISFCPDINLMHLRNTSKWISAP